MKKRLSRKLVVGAFLFGPPHSIWSSGARDQSQATAAATPGPLTQWNLRPDTEEMLPVPLYHSGTSKENPALEICWN